MLFAKASNKELKEILQCLQDFSNISGLTINYEKSKIFFSPNLRADLVRNWSRDCGIPSTRNLGKYLGVPLRHGKIGRRHYEFILDRMRAKLASWKAHSLSLAGRTVLVKSAMASIPVYQMQSQMLPAHIKRRRRSQRQISARQQLGHVIQTRVANPHRRPSWRSILKCREVLQGGIQWTIGDGSQTSFWFHPWINGKAITQISDHIRIPEEGKCWTVADFFTDDKTWDKPLLEAWLPNELVEKILSIPIPINPAARDGPIWKLTAKGTFSTTSAHKHIQGVSNPLSDFTPQLLDNNNLKWNWISMCRMWFDGGVVASHHKGLLLREGCLETNWNEWQLLGWRRRSMAQGKRHQDHQRKDTGHSTKHSIPRNDLGTLENEEQTFL